MSLARLLSDLLAFWVQGVLVTAVAAALARALPIHRPAVKLAWWQAVLAATLVLPFLGSWGPVPGGRFEVQFEVAGEAASAPGSGLAAVPWTLVVAGLLAIGLLVRSTRLVGGTLRLRSYRRRSTTYDTLALAGLEDAVGARADVRLSREVAVPATFGLRHPVVLLPAHVPEMETERQRAIVAHELIHVRRRDWPVAVLEEVLAAALWFHPAVSFLVGRIRLAREQCVDSAVVEMLGGRRTDYLESLLAVAARRARPQPIPAALFLGEHHLAERVELLLKEVAMSKVRALSHLSLSALFLLLAGAAASSSFPLSAAADSERESKGAATAKAKVREPRLVHKVNPVYPPEAKKDRLEGLVHVDARLGKDGAVAEATATDGHPTLAEAALAAVRQWRYEPALGPDKKPVEVRITITVNFRLAPQ